MNTTRQTQILTATRVCFCGSLATHGLRCGTHDAIAREFLTRYAAAHQDEVSA